MVFVGGPGEKRAAGVHFGHDAAGGPDVDGGVVGAGTKENVGSAVPEGDNFVGEGVDGDAEGPGETKVGKFELTLIVYQEVLGLEVAVKDAVFMAKCDSLKKLVHKGFDSDVV